MLPVRILNSAAAEIIDREGGKHTNAQHTE